MTSLPAPSPSTFAWLQGGGDMGALMRSIEWAATPLGAVSAWPQSLRSAVSICLGSRFPIVILWGPDYITLYNDGYAPMLGAKHPWAVGHSLRDIWGEIWDLIGPMLDGVRRTGEATWSDDQLLILERNGFPEECYFSYSFGPARVEDGSVGGIFTAVIETTGRVVGERRLRLLRDLGERTAHAANAADACTRAAAALGAAPDLPFAFVYLFDADGVGRLAGASSPAGDPAPPPVIRAADQALPAGRLARAVPIAAAGQEPMGLLVAGLHQQRPFDDDYRSFLDLVAGRIASAVTDARALEAERARAEALAELDRAKTTFFSNISHEFRTPLTLMLGPLEDALAGAPSGDERERIELVYRNVLRLLKLVNALLDFARIEAGRAEARYRPTDLARLTSDLASVFRSAIERAGLRLTVRCEPLDEPVYVDRDMWEKIVLNLLSNALKYTLEGDIDVALRRDGGACLLTVRDTGAGIPADAIGLIFERFHRAPSTAGRTQEGSGIGLALVQELVKLHGGTIAVASEVGRGTTFTVTVPCGRSHLPQGRVDERAEPATDGTSARPFLEEALRWIGSDEIVAPAGPDSGSGPGAAHGQPAGRVLVVDDNADMRSYLARLLGSRYEVEVAPDGEHALEAARRRPPDLVVSDVMMPRLDGFGLLTALRASRATAAVPVILLSARAGEESRLDGLARGADDYVVKPFSARDLLARVDVQLLRGRLRATAEEERRRLLGLFEQAPAAIAILHGAEHVFEFVNPAYLRLVGARTVLGRGIREALPELDGQGIFELLDGVYASGHPHQERARRVSIVRREGAAAEDTWFDFVYQPIQQADGGVQGIAVVAFDVTDVVRARREAESANRAKDEFLAMLGHELRNPLAPIVTALQLMSLRGDAAALPERAMIERQVRHLVRLVDDLLDVSRIAQGKVVLRREPLEIADIVTRAVEMASPLLEERQHVLSVDVPHGGLAVSGDLTRLAQVVMNLLTNAAKYTEPTGTIAVRAARVGGDVELRIRDTGVGISAEMLPRVFDLFAQESQTFERSRGGLGLGLTIVRSLVEMHGGRVEARSEGIGRGSEFVIRLPLLDVEAVARHTADSRQAPVRQGGRRLRVLVVDDNADAAEMMRQVLVMAGHEPRVALDAAAAIDTCRSFRPDVALLDLGLPVMDGYQLAARLRHEHADAPPVMIAVTGYGQDTDRRRSEAAGFYGHLVKPVDLDELETLLFTMAERLPEA